MNQLTNEEIASVFAMYLHTQVSFDNRIGNIVSYYLSCSHILKQVWVISLEDENFEKNELSCSIEITQAKLLLTPLNKITDEQLTDIAKIYGGLWAKLDDNFLQVINKNNEVVRYFLIDHELPFMLSQYFIQQNYAIPLFFGVNHWANNKTAIELKIAIEK